MPEQPKCMHCEILREFREAIEREVLDPSDPTQVTDVFERFFDQTLSGLAAVLAGIEDPSARASWIQRADAVFGPAVDAHRRGEQVFRPRALTRH
ncbi:MAG: hypothetical protein RIB45_17740 [Marivibrio sp.]|uniref:hypothetical protein n=1 Tax=Marivibrio sp. TaxID=2039719 RepID=UPI0032EC43E0